MKPVAAKIVPKLLIFEQKQCRMNINDDQDLLNKVTTANEPWVYSYNIVSKGQSSQWRLPEKPRPKKARQVRPNVKVLLTAVFDFNGMVYRELLHKVVRSIRNTALKLKRSIILAIVTSPLRGDDKDDAVLGVSSKCDQTDKWLQDSV